MQGGHDKRRHFFGKIETEKSKFRFSKELLDINDIDIEYVISSGNHSIGGNVSYTLLAITIMLMSFVIKLPNLNGCLLSFDKARKMIFLLKGSDKSTLCKYIKI